MYNKCDAIFSTTIIMVMESPASSPASELQPHIGSSSRETPRAFSSSQSSTSTCKDVQSCKNIGMLWEAVMDLTKKDRQTRGATLYPSEQSEHLRGMFDVSLLNICLPLKTEEEFLQFEEKLKELIFRQKVARMLLTLNGNSVKSLAANLLRKILSDNVAETFSLTG
ncbi:uncharacterized protein LOC129004204 [Macrosteles quadrilineatus]|uniref:uncharacterized protein LOC129004204 n=1 Tax=Macrosteles quadrilineatus TaxID=74068 RepID=UPI0023E0CB69|nr:uncharacterized protein LOC129004204 [Macrosteles quadrilineatus]